MSYASFSLKNFNYNYDNDYDLFLYTETRRHGGLFDYDNDYDDDFWRLLLCRGSLVKMAFKHGLYGILTALLWHSYNA